MALKRRRDVNMWKEFFMLYFITITSGLFCLMPFVIGETVCYTRIPLDEHNRLIKKVKCDGPHEICKRFLSSDEVNWVDLLNSPCDDPDYFFPQGESKQEKEIQEIECQDVDLPTINAGLFNCSGYSVGDKCNLICNEGYYPSSTKETVCEVNAGVEGNWSVGTFECSAITCQEIDLPTINAGFFNCSGYSVGDKCNLTCNEGYYPSSTKETVCEVNADVEGNWSAGTFECSDCNNWNEWNGKEYKPIRTFQSWENSRLLCENENGHLITIESKDKNDFVEWLLLQCVGSKSAWIGLNDLIKEDMWEWSDGTVVTYTNWNEGEPNEYLGTPQECVRIYIRGGKWDDHVCSTGLQTLCERSKTLS